MPELPRLNPAIRALESGKPAFVTFSPPEISAAQAIAAAPYDAVVFEMEHNPYDIRTLRDCMQYMLDRAQILKSGSLAPAVAPFVRIPPNGGEMNQFIAKQVLDIGVYGIVWPHVSTVEEARNAVQACRYPRPREAKYYEPAGQRGDAPRNAARYWGIDQQTYYKRADTWPLNPEGGGTQIAAGHSTERRSTEKGGRDGRFLPRLRTPPDRYLRRRDQPGDRRQRPALAAAARLSADASVVAQDRAASRRGIHAGDP